MIRVSVEYVGDYVYFRLQDKWGEAFVLSLEETDDLLNQLRDKVAEVVVHYETQLKLVRVEGEV